MINAVNTESERRRGMKRDSLNKLSDETDPLTDDKDDSITENEVKVNNIRYHIPTKLNLTKKSWKEEENLSQWLIKAFTIIQSTDKGDAVFTKMDENVMKRVITMGKKLLQIYHRRYTLRKDNIEGI